MMAWSVQRIALAKPPRPNIVCAVEMHKLHWTWLLAVGMHGDELSIWMRTLFSDPVMVTEKFFIACTGGICPPQDAGTPLGTVIDGENRWHVFLIDKRSDWKP